MLAPGAGVFVLVLSFMPSVACVIPVAPSFTDPPASANYAPIIISTAPEQNQEETIIGSLAFSVTVSDPNLNDDLYYLWVVDFPPFTTSTRTPGQGTIPHNANGTAARPPISVVVDCNLNPGPAATEHQLLAIVADRPFVGQGNDLDEVAQGGLSTRATWPFQISCLEPPSP